MRPPRKPAEIHEYWKCYCEMNKWWKQADFVLLPLYYPSLLDQRLMKGSLVFLFPYGRQVSSLENITFIHKTTFILSIPTVLTYAF